MAAEQQSQQQSIGQHLDGDDKYVLRLLMKLDNAISIVNQLSNQNQQLLERIKYLENESTITDKSESSE